MKKVTIILGPNGSGKTTLAKKIAEGRKAAFKINDLTINTEILVLDEFFDVDKIYSLSTCEIIWSESIGLARQPIPRPDIVFTSNLYKAEDFNSLRRPYIQIIELK